MYQYSYSEIIAEGATDARAAERRALDHAIALLGAAVGSRPKSPPEVEALSFTSHMWSILARIDAGQSRDFAALAEICGIIRDGLA